MSVTKTVKNWNRMRKAVDLGWAYYINVGNTYVCYMKFVFVRIFSQSVEYWYEICEVLVPKFHVL